MRYINLRLTYLQSSQLSTFGKPSFNINASIEDEVDIVPFHPLTFDLQTECRCKSYLPTLIEMSSADLSVKCKQTYTHNARLLNRLQWKLYPTLNYRWRGVEWRRSGHRRSYYLHAVTSRQSQSINHLFHTVPNLWTRLRTLQLSILTNISTYRSPAASGKMAGGMNLTVSTSHHSMWWQRRRLWCVERLCDGLLLAFYDQFIEDYPGIRVLVHWCFYEKKSEWEVRYKGLMIVCCRSLLSNSATDDDIDDVSPTQRAIKTVVPVWCWHWQRFAVHHVAKLTQTENYMEDTEYTMYSSAGTLYKLKCKIKYRYQGIYVKF